jgi:hypothetical protein
LEPGGIDAKRIGIPDVQLKCNGIVVQGIVVIGNEAQLKSAKHFLRNKICLLKGGL